MIDSRVNISNAQLGSYNDEREFDISLRMQRRLIVSGYSAEHNVHRIKPRSLKDEFIEHAF